MSTNHSFAPDKPMLPWRSMKRHRYRLSNAIQRAQSTSTLVATSVAKRWVPTPTLVGQLIVDVESRSRYQLPTNAVEMSPNKLFFACKYYKEGTHSDVSPRNTRILLYRVDKPERVLRQFGTNVLVKMMLTNDGTVWWRDVTGSMHANEVAAGISNGWHVRVDGDRICVNYTDLYCLDKTTNSVRKISDDDTHNNVCGRVVHHFRGDRDVLLDTYVVDKAFNHERYSEYWTRPSDQTWIGIQNYNLHQLYVVAKVDRKEDYTRNCFTCTHAFLCMEANKDELVVYDPVHPRIRHLAFTGRTVRNYAIALDTYAKSDLQAPAVLPSQKRIHQNLLHHEKKHGHKDY